jgi:hypothetical protein
MGAPGSYLGLEASRPASAILPMNFEQSLQIAKDLFAAIDRDDMRGLTKCAARPSNLIRAVASAIASLLTSCLSLSTS